MPVITQHRIAVRETVLEVQADNGLTKSEAISNLELEFGSTTAESRDEIDLIIKKTFEAGFTDTETWPKTRTLIISLDGGVDGYSAQAGSWITTITQSIKGSADGKLVRLKAARERKQDKRDEHDAVRDEAVLAIAVVNGNNIVQTDNLRDALTKGKNDFAKKVQDLDLTITRMDEEIAVYEAMV